MNGGSGAVDYTMVDQRLARSGEGMRAHDNPLELDSADQVFLSDDEAEMPSPWAARVMAGVLVVIGLAWTAWMVTRAWSDIGTMPAVTLAGFVASLCAVPALLGIGWLLALRTSRREARRFADTAAAMRAESQRLEQQVAQLAMTVEEGRGRLAEQTTALLAMGERAAERLAGVSDGMAHEVSAVDAHVSRLAEAATTTQTSLGVLLASLPRAHEETAAMAGALDSAGLAAGGQVAALDAQLVALTERGREADAVTGGAAQRLAAHLARMEAMAETTAARLDATVGQMSGAVDGLLERAAQAMEQSHRGMGAQGEAMLAMIEANQASLEQAGRDSVDALSLRIADIERVIGRVAEQLAQQQATSDALFERLGNGIGEAETRLGALHQQGVDQTQLLAASISALGGSADAMTESLKAGNTVARSVIGTTEDLLTALDAASREIDETLPEALARLDARIAASKAVVVDARPELLALVTAAESTHEAIEAIAGVVSEQAGTVDRLSATLLDTLEEGRARADALGEVMDGTIARTRQFSDSAAPQLVEALLRVRDTAATAADRARETLASVIPEAAAAMEKASGEAMRRAAGSGVTDRIASLAEAADHAVAAATRASDRLAGQLQAIADATAIVETRIEDAREERDAANKDGLARRVSLLIESLNSAAIDITKSFSHEVSDSAWAAYLKGDRGVFTRRAVRLMDAGEAREVTRLYDDDAAFREQVNRYIHDFEAMLRSILALREGSPLGVTLLSSDMGKLYVVLAQAIDRLR